MLIKCWKCVQSTGKKVQCAKTENAMTIIRHSGHMREKQNWNGNFQVEKTGMRNSKSSLTVTEIEIGLHRYEVSKPLFCSNGCRNISTSNKDAAISFPPEPCTTQILLTSSSADHILQVELLPLGSFPDNWKAVGVESLQMCSSRDAPEILLSWISPQIL